jgi:transketolase
MKLNSIFIFTHDSLAVGEDGPTHEPVEQLASLRCIPGLTVIRPGDANETSIAWKYIVENPNGPVALILTRQDLPVIDREKYAPADYAIKGGYVLSDDKNAEIILIATGSEVHIALEAAEKLRSEGKKVRVVNILSTEIFEKQSEEYREKVLPSSTRRRVVVEAGTTFGWEKYATMNGRIIGVDRFGESAPGDIVLEKFGFTAENIVKTAKELF